jgi:WD40 repeat protein
MYQKLIFLFVFSLFLLSAGRQMHSQTEVLWSKYFYDANGVKFSADGNVVLVAARDSLLYLFDTYTGEPTKYEKIAFDHDIDYADFNFLDVSKDGKYILGSDFFRCKLWDYENGKLYYNYDLRRQITDIIFHPDCKHVIITYSDYETKNIQLLNIKTNSFVKSADLDGKGDKIAVSEDGRFFAVSEIVGHWSMNLTLWDLQTFTMIKRFPASALYVAINDIAFSPDGKYLAATDKNGYIKVWDTETRELVFNKKHEESEKSQVYETCLKFTHDNKYLVTSGGYVSNVTTKKWQIPEFELYCINEDPNGFAYDLDIHKSNSLATGNRGNIIVFSLCDEELIVNENVSDTLQYPNPVKDIITIELEQELSPQIKIELFDNSGKLVKNFSFDEIMINNTSITLDMAFLSPGSYFLIISSDGFSKTYPFLKL